MLGLSTADGFMSVKEGVDDMIKYLANEPSVGLYFVQQHAQSSMPYLLDVKDKVMEKIHEVTLHTEDVEEAIDEVRSMIEIGYPLSEEMIKDIKKSLLIISKCQPKRGLIQIPSWGLQTDSSNSNAAVAVGCSNMSGHQEDEGNRGYLSDVFSSAKQRAAGFRRRPIILPSNFDRPVQPSSQSPFESDATTQSYAEAKELPVSSSLEINEKPPLKARMTVKPCSPWKITANLNMRKKLNLKHGCKSLKGTASLLGLGIDIYVLGVFLRQLPQ